MTKICTVCGKLFNCPPSAKTVTCSPECSHKHRSSKHKGVKNQWSTEARSKVSAKGKTSNLQKGTPAAQKSLIAGRFTTNREAKHWYVKSPEGIAYEFTNLMLWARDHTDLFDKPPGDRSARQIAAGFYTAKRAILGHGKGTTITYMDWQITETKY